MPLNFDSQSQSTMGGTNHQSSLSNLNNAPNKITGGVTNLVPIDEDENDEQCSPLKKSPPKVRPSSAHSHRVVSPIKGSIEMCDQSGAEHNESHLVIRPYAISTCSLEEEP